MSLFLHRSGMLAGLDPLTVAYAAASGATSLAGIDAIIRYARAESLLSNIRLYPMKSAQNAGTGTTVYGIGSLTANNMTLINGPTWGAGGLAFVAASSHDGEILDFLGAGDVTVFDRVAMTNTSPTATQSLHLQWNPTGDQRSWWTRIEGATAGDPFALFISATGKAAGTGTVTTTGNHLTTSSVVYVSKFTATGVASIWKDKALISSSTIASGRYNSNANIIFSNAGDPVRTCCAVITGDLTTTQRETLTDLINAL
jgi:hypothetical protein